MEFSPPRFEDAKTAPVPSYIGTRAVGLSRREQVMRQVV
jgi:hypothetical protein